MTTPQAKPRPGVTCPKCGGRAFRTVYTRYQFDATVRVRKCKDPACGHRIRTAERVASRSA